MAPASEDLTLGTSTYYVFAHNANHLNFTTVP